MHNDKITESRNYYVLGLGQTGLSVVRYLKKKGHWFEVFDDKISLNGLEAFQKEFPEIKVHLHDNSLDLESFKKVHEVIISPGVPLDHPIAQKAREFNIPIIGDIELFARINMAPVVAITGTNGKSTVTTLMGEMAKVAGLKVLVGGNIGTPVLDFVNESFDWIVLELSSFQLDSTYTLKPKIACILNITEDHLDRYENFDAYVNAKHRIYQQAENIVFSADDKLTYPKNLNQLNTDERIITFGVSHSNQMKNSWHILEKDNQKYLAYNHQIWLDVNDLKIKGTHNWSNALAALAIGQYMRIEKSILCKVLKEFPGLEHRCQWVRELNKIHWYNDSKGTNVGATLSAIQGLGGALTGKIILLLGGQSKGADFSDLCDSLKEHVRAVILYGEDADKIEQMLKKSPQMIPIIRKNTFEAVVKTAYKQALPNDVVLLSPACASWDMFENYGHRGRVFTEMVLKLQ